MTKMIEGNPIGTGLEMNASIREYPSLGGFISDDSNLLSYIYLKQKLEKWMKEGNTEKVVSYYLLLIKKDFSKAPNELVELVRDRVKPYLRSTLLL